MICNDAILLEMPMRKFRRFWIVFGFSFVHFRYSLFAFFILYFIFYF